MSLKRIIWIAIALLVCFISATSAKENAPEPTPAGHFFASPGDVDLKTYVFSPDAADKSVRRSAIVIFHGGGQA